ncbi:MAG: hypothetical protein IPQ09_00410 [Myxococcales bacterium]|nr:hypothetical protein [Myxococcales bacterium]
MLARARALTLATQSTFATFATLATLAALALVAALGGLGLGACGEAAPGTTPEDAGLEARAADSTGPDPSDAAVPPDAAASDAGTVDAAVIDADAAPRPVPPLPWTDDPCAGVDAGADPFADVVREYARQDDLAPPAKGGLVVVGSSTIRRWRSAARVLSAHDPLQRGVGGARMVDLAAHAEALVLRHGPAGVLLFAGTNDLAGGSSPRAVIDAYRCFATRLHARRPGAPLLYVGITPTPARWAGWASAALVNQEIARLATTHPSLRYIDSPAAFLAAATAGEPPPARLFVADGLHLSAEGYALFESTVLPAVAAALPSSRLPLPAPPTPGTLVRVDLGPSNPLDGTPAPAIDAFGIRWNSWHAVDGGQQVHAGEALRRLRGTRGETTNVSLVITGGFRVNGLRNGGLVSPEASRLGTLAVPESTGDFFYSGDPDDAAGLALEGLAPSGRYTLRLFASRAAADERRTGFTVRGAGAARSASVQTSGAGLGAGGAQANDREVTVLAGLTPDARGRLFVDVDRWVGPFAYVNLLELQVDP